jgi:hypothetical protein
LTLESGGGGFESQADDVLEALQDVVAPGIGKQPLGEVHAQNGESSQIFEPRFRDVESRRLLLEDGN